MIHDGPRILRSITAPGELAPPLNMARHIPGLIAAFIGEERIAGGLALDAQIPRDRLDSRIDSLPALDGYLCKLRATMSQIDDKTMTLTVLAAGCYLGDVIRRHSTAPWEWVNYDDHFPRSTKLTSIVPYNLGTCLVLRQSCGALSLPIHQVGRFLKEREGREYTTHAFAQWQIARG